jgi:two-component system, OmpR family, sensor histidine kinase CiaH
MPFTFFKSKRLKLIFVIYWILLLYICAALIWWFIALNQQNTVMANYKKQELKADNPNYLIQLEKINDVEIRKKGQYLGEGFIFFLLIIAGAVFVFRAVQKQLKAGQQQQNFMMAITHELKTPIAITKLNLETLQKHQLEITQQQKLIQNTIQEANRLNNLCNNLLLSSQIEAGGYTITKETIHFTELITGCVADFTLRFPERKIETSITNAIKTQGDYLMIQMMANNLIDNAIKYSTKNSLVKVIATENNQKIQFKVIDEGKGIDPANKEKIFEKFFRAESNGVKAAKGTGLGLYLSKKIIQQHKGNIYMTQNLNEGSTFTVELNSIT